MLVFFAAGGRQIVGRAFTEAALGLKIRERLRRERDEFAQIHFARLVFHELDQLPPDALIFVRRADVKARQLALLLFGINVQRHARDRIFINLKKVIIAQAFLDARLAALDQFVRLDRRLGQHLDGPDVLFLRRPDLLVFVRVNERADAVIGKDFREQAFVHLAVDDVDARNSSQAGERGVLRFRERFRRKPGDILLQQLLQIRHEHLANELPVVTQAILRGDENQFDGLERVGHGHRHAVGIHPVGLAIAVKPERRDDGNDTLIEQRLEHFHIHALDLAGEQMVHALDDAHGMGDDGVRAGGPQVIGRKPFENFVREPVRGGQRQIERGRVRDPAAAEIGGLDFLLVGQRLDLRGRAVDEHNPDVQRPQHRHVQQQRGEVLVGDNRAVHREDERLFAELRYVLQDAPQVGQFHFGSLWCFNAEISIRFSAGFK